MEVPLNTKKRNKTDALRKWIWLFIGAGMIGAMQTTPAAAGLITASDVALAKSVIAKNTRSLPGMTVGSRVKVGSGNFSTSDALILYMLKFHQQTTLCPPIAAVAEALKRLNDAEVHKKAVAIFWREYSTCSNLDASIRKPDFLESTFEWYILTKQTERLKISNARLQGFVGSDEAWRRAMNSQQQFWEKSRSREDEFLLKRGAHRVTLDAQAAVADAERAVAGAY